MGTKVVAEVLAMFPDTVETVLVQEGYERGPVDTGAAGLSVHVLDRALFRELDMFGTGSPLLVVEIPRPLPLAEGFPGTDAALCIPFQDPANVGAAIRSSVAFGVRDIVLLREAAHPFHPKSVRAGGTALFMARYHEGPPLGKLGEVGLPVVALDAGGVPLDRYRFPRSCAILAGQEGPGLPETLSAAERVSIPMSSGVESLNAAVAVSIALYEYRRRHLSGQ